MLIQDAIKHIKEKNITASFNGRTLVFKGDIDSETDNIIEDFKDELYIVAATKEVFRTGNEPRNKKVQTIITEVEQESPVTMKKQPYLWGI